MGEISQAKSAEITRKNLLGDEKLNPFVHFLPIFTQMGVLVSTSQALVGAVVGVRIVKELKTVSGKMLVEIGTGWVSTALLFGLLFYSRVRKNWQGAA